MISFHSNDERRIMSLVQSKEICAEIMEVMEVMDELMP